MPSDTSKPSQGNRPALPDEELSLFREAVAGARPIRAEPPPPSLQRPKPAPLPLQRLRDEHEALELSQLSDLTPETLLDTDESLSFARDGIGRDTLRKLRRGHWTVQAELDLHGFRVDEAREVFAEFIRQCERRGHRCVRVIHGKGLGSVGREPVLKMKVQGWLRQKTEVLAFCQSPPQQGGSGAVLVLLRSSRQA